MERELVGARAVAAALEAEHSMLTTAIIVLIQQNQRFSAEAAELARERSEVRLALNRVRGRIRRMEADSG